MTEHFPKSTETATGWCKQCNRNTEHRVDDGRLGPCIDPKHPAPPIREVPGKGRSRGEPEQKGLFEK